MLIDTLKYKENIIGPFVPLEEWMKLAHFIGWFSREQEESVKIYVSVPSSLLFSYFIALGLVDHEFQQEIDSSIFKRKLLNLKLGSQVLYLSDANWKKCTVLGLDDFPADRGEIALKVKDQKNSVTYVPERKWLTNVRIFSNEVSEVKNAKIVKNVSNLVEDKILNLFYSKENLGAVEMKNKPKAIISAIKTEWIENLSAVKFFAKNHHMHFGNFIFYEERKSTFNNIKLLSEKEKLNDQQLEQATILFVGAGRSIRKMDEYKTVKSIYLVDKYESTEKIEDLKMKIAQNFLIDGCVSINEKLVSELNQSKIDLPKGVEIFAWK